MDQRQDAVRERAKDEKGSRSNVRRVGRGSIVDKADRHHVPHRVQTVQTINALDYLAMTTYDMRHCQRCDAGW